MQFLMFAGGLLALVVGAGLLVRGDRVSPALIARAVARLLGEDGFTQRAHLLQATHRERKGESPLGDHLVRLATKNRRHRAPPPS